MSTSFPFSPRYGSGQVLTATSSAASTAINNADQQVRIVNTGAQKAYVRTYSSLKGTLTVSATAADFVIPAGMASTLTKPTGGDFGHDTLTYISAAGTTLEVITGSGV